MSQTSWNWIITIVGGLIVAVAAPFVSSFFNHPVQPRLSEIAEKPAARPAPSDKTPTNPEPHNSHQADEQPSSKPPSDPPITQIGPREVSEFVEWTYLRDRESYADSVDYYDRGRVNRAFIAKDKREFFNRWPVRKYMLTPGSLELQVIGEEYIATFSYRFIVANGGKRLEGVGRSQVRLTKLNDGFIVTGVKEIASTNQ